MNRKFTLITLIVSFLLSSLLAVFTTDMILNVVVNKGGDMKIFTGLVPAFLSVVLVIVFLGTLRVYLRPNSRKKAIKLYTLLILIFSGIGAIVTILSGIVDYHSLVKPYPFPGFNLIFLIGYVLLAGCAAFARFFLAKKIEDDTEEFHVNAKHVFKTIGWFLFISLTMNRTGVFFISPFFIQWRLFGLTFVYYIFLLVPLCLGIVKILRLLGYMNNQKVNLITSIVLCAVTVGLIVAVVVLGSTHSEFISAISHAMGLERIASFPFEIIIHSASYIAVSTILLVQSIKSRQN
jgi:hypothetical protein